MILWRRLVEARGLGCSRGSCRSRLKAMMAGVWSPDDGESGGRLNGGDGGDSGWRLLVLGALTVAAGVG